MLNISIFVHVNTQRKGGNLNRWYQKPFSATVVMQTTSVPLEVQTPAREVQPAGLQPSIIQYRRNPHPNPINVPVNPAVVGDGRDETPPHARTTLDRRLGDGRDNA